MGYQDTNAGLGPIGGTTFLWLEHYDTRGRSLDLVRDVVFSVVIVIIAAGTAAFVNLDRPVYQAGGIEMGHLGL
jgi:hypothetical protein